MPFNFFSSPSKNEKPIFPQLKSHFISSDPLCFSPNDEYWIYFDSDKKAFLPLFIEDTSPIEAFMVSDTIFTRLKDNRWFKLEINCSTSSKDKKSKNSLPTQLLLEGCASDEYLEGSTKLDKIDLSEDLSSENNTDFLESSNKLDFVKPHSPEAHLEGYSPINILAIDGAIFLQHPDNSWFAAGENRCGELGFYHNEKIKNFQRIIIENKPVVKIVSSDSGTFFKIADGRWFNSGNTEFKNGFSSASVCVNEFKIHGESPESIIIHDEVIAAKMHDERVYIAGDNRCGQLAQGTKDDFINKFVPLKIEGVFPEQIILSSLNTFAQHPDGRWFGCGINYNGQLGLGHKKNVRSFCEIKIDGITPSEIFAEPCGVFFKMPDGRVFACGDNTQGRLGLGESVEYSITPMEILINNTSPTKILRNFQVTLFKVETNDWYICGDLPEGLEKFISNEDSCSSTNNLFSPEKLVLPNDLKFTEQVNFKESGHQTVSPHSSFKP